MTGLGSGEELRDRLGIRLTRVVVLAHVIGAVLAGVSGTLTGANIKDQRGFGRLDVVTLCVYLPAALAVGGWSCTRQYKRTTAWMVDQRMPTPDEQRQTLAQPQRQAVVGMLGWLGAAVIWSLLSAVSHSAAYTVRVAMSIVLGGLVTSALTYLLVESALRPIVALALAGDVPHRIVAAGVRTKLLLSWALGADVFLLMVGLTFIGRPARQPPSPGAIWFIVGAGLVAGTLVLFVTARSLADPLTELRRAVGRVQRGDLDGDVPVNDGGELGLLQAGFNKMLVGLRERRTLEDLFGRQVGDDVARQALEQGVKLGGERRDVGVLFVDVIGSTALAQSHSPDRVVELLNHFFATIVRVVAAEGGWVNKFEGDGALCVFGAPVQRDDYAVRALRAARSIRQELLALSALERELDAAIGVSAGTVVAGNIGDERRYEYTVIGPAVNEAARLTDEAKHHLGRVLASEEAVGRSGEEAGAWTVIDELLLRGQSDPILVYEPAAALTLQPAAR